MDPPIFPCHFYAYDALFQGLRRAAARVQLGDLWFPSNLLVAFEFPFVTLIAFWFAARAVFLDFHLPLPFLFYSPLIRGLADDSIMLLVIILT
jgi:hypothetical protein